MTIDPVKAQLVGESVERDPAVAEAVKLAFERAVFKARIVWSPKTKSYVTVACEVEGMELSWVKVKCDGVHGFYPEADPFDRVMYMPVEAELGGRYRRGELGSWREFRLKAPMRVTWLDHRCVAESTFAIVLR